MAKHPTPSFPVRQGNRFRLLVDGEAFFPAILEALAGARHSIACEFYLVESGLITSQFISAWLDAVQRGVQVYLLFDDFGARLLNRRDRERLIHGGVHLAFYNPVRGLARRSHLFRDHRKLILVDDRLACTGGFGLTDHFNPDSAPAPWHDTALFIEGPLIQDWWRLFRHNWLRWSMSAPSSPHSRHRTAAGESSGQLLTNQPPLGNDIKRHLIRRLFHASKEAWLATPYFVPSRKLRRALVMTARRGVDVRILVAGDQSGHPGVSEAGRRFYTRLLRQGVRIFEYQPRVMHQKLVLIDEWAMLGSSNLDRWNHRWNLEANQAIDNARFARQLRALFEQDFDNAEEIHLHLWERRNWRSRLRQRWFGWLDRLSDRWLR